MQKSSGYASTKFVGQTLKTAQLGAGWTEVKVQLPAAERPGMPVLYLRFAGTVGSIFWDDVSLHVNSTDRAEPGHQLKTDDAQAFAMRIDAGTVAGY